MKKSFVCSMAALCAVMVSGAELFQDDVVAPFVSGGHCAKPAAKVLKLDDLHGDGSNGYALRINARGKDDLNRLPFEIATAKCSYDNDYFYASMTANDSEVYTEATGDNQNLRGLGDTFSIFIRPEKSVGMWEICVTPNGKRFCIYYPGPGNMVMDFAEKCPVDGIKVKNSIDGKLNCRKVDDKAWTVSVAIPRKIFAAKGFKFVPQENWQIIFVRINFSTKLIAKESSSFPQSARNFFDANRYAALKLGAEK